MKQSKVLTEAQVLKIRSSWNPDKVVATNKFLRDLSHTTYKEAVDMFEKRTIEWYFDVADYLDKSEKPGANFTVTILCCILLDLLSQYASGLPSSSKAVFKDFFRNNFGSMNKKIKPPIKTCYYDDRKSWVGIAIKDIADGLYHCFRSSILHCGRILEYGRINSRYPEEVIKVLKWNNGREINFNPSAFLKKLRKVFENYITKLKDEDPNLKAKFIDKIKWEYGVVLKDV